MTLRYGHLAYVSAGPAPIHAPTPLELLTRHAHSQGRKAVISIPPRTTKKVAKMVRPEMTSSLSRNKRLKRRTQIGAVRLRGMVVEIGASFQEVIRRVAARK
jgi:hypothetical protein